MSKETEKNEETVKTKISLPPVGVPIPDEVAIAFVTNMAFRYGWVTKVIRPKSSD